MRHIWMKTIGMLMAAIAIGAGASPAKAEFISTLGSWDNSNFISAFGEPNTATYGQTITVGTDNVLNSYSFRLRYLQGAGPVIFAGYVMAWDGSKATGNVLFQSGPQSLPSTSSGFTTFTFNTPGTTLTPGGQYVLFISASNYFDNNLDSAAMGWTNANSYAGGSFVFSNNGSDFNSLTTGGWSSFGGNDSAFTADLTPPPEANVVPAPAGIVLLGIGLTGLGGFRLFRRKPAVAVS